ncbi:MAG: hypothetical protein EAZ58_04455, partial [Flavobacterium sp.]
NVTVDIGGAKGTQSSTQIAIWQWDGVTQINSKRYAGIGEDVSIGAFGLTPGSTYYISVDTFNSSTIGSFTLCLQSTIDYDFYEGAIDVTSFINSCSPNASYTTVGGSPDKLAGSNWNNSGPKFNRWFKFTASTAYMNIIVDIGTVTGTQFYTQMALWQSDGITEIASQTYATSVNGPDVSVESSNLIPGNTYYISVDSRGDTSWGTFTLCLKEGLKAVDDTGIAINGFVGGTSISNILQNDKLNGNAIVASQVNLSFVSSTNSGITLSGTSVLVAAGTPQGTYTLTYSICDILNPLNCDQATVTINVTAPVINAVNDTYSPSCSTTGLIGNIFSNDTLNGASLMPNNVTVSIISGANPNISIDALTGNITITNDLYLNQYILVYSICENNNPSNCATATIQVNLNVTVWDGNFWSNGEPDSAKDIIFSEDKILTSDLIACSCHINNSANVIVGSGIDLTIVNNLSVDSGSSLIVENNANLIQINDVTNSGNIIVNRNSAPIVRLDHTLWSTPVTGQQTLQQFSPQTLSNRFYVYNTVSNSFSPIGMTSTFPLAKAIGIRAPNNWGTNPSEWSGSFVGTPNNGNILYSVSTVGYNGVGNPYPSTIDGSAFISANSDKITGTLYFYAHTLSMNSVGVFPSGTNYATWNPGMGGTPASVGSGGTGSSPVIPNGIIQVGQGFFVKATQLGDLSFTNSMRIGNSDNQFFRTSSTSSISSTEYNIERHRIWLNLSNPTNPLNTILVGYAAGATNDIDNGFDGLSFGSAGSYLYSVLNNSNYTIQGRALPFLIDDEVSLGFKASEAGVFTISIYDVDGLFDGSQDIFIKDLQLETITNIKNNSYTFTSDVGTFDNRFKIVYKEPQLSSDLFLNENNVLLYMNYETLFIKSNISLISKVIVSDIQGRIIYEKGDINNSNFQTDAIKATDQVVLVKIFSQNGSIFTKKIML